MISDVGTWRATFLPFVIQTTEGRKDPGCIAQPEVDVTEILHFVQDDMGGKGPQCATLIDV